MIRFRSIIIVNVVLVLLFVASNFVVWDAVDIHPVLGNTVMNPINVIVSMWGTVVDGNIERVDGMSILPNLPFWIFFVALAVNLYFIFKLSKKQQIQTQ